MKIGRLLITSDTRTTGFQYFLLPIIELWYSCYDNDIVLTFAWLRKSANIYFYRAPKKIRETISK